MAPDICCLKVYGTSAPQSVLGGPERRPVAVGDQQQKVSAALLAQHHSGCRGPEIGEIGEMDAQEPAEHSSCQTAGLDWRWAEVRCAEAVHQAVCLMKYNMKPLP